ncbi:MAG: hypothetical protein ACJ73S_14445 [Mycobacteriales bacterium]
MGAVRPVEAGRLFRDLLPVPPEGPLPILTLYGPSRTRNRALLDQLAEACRGAEPHPLPHVRLHVDGRGQGWTRRDALAELVYRFSRISHPQFGGFTFPRYLLGRWMVDLDLTDVDSDQVERRVRDQLCQRKRIEQFFPQADNAGGVGAFVLSLVPVLFARLGVPLVLRSRGPWRRWIWGPGLSYYERNSRALGLHSRGSLTALAVEVNGRAADTDDPVDQRVVDRMLVTAFLEDLRAGYDRRRSRRAVYRTAACVALLDDVDSRPEAGAGLLALIAEVRAGARTPDPLLVAATSAVPLPPGRPGLDGSTAPDAGADGGEGRPPEAFLELWRAAGADAVAAGAAGMERIFLNLRVQAGREPPHPLRHHRLPWRRDTDPGGPPPVTDEPVQVTVPRPPFRRTRAFRVLVAGTVAALLLAGYGTAYAVQRAGGCQPAGMFSPAAVVRNAVGNPALGTEYAPDGECIGLTDAAGHLPGSTREVNGMLDDIAAENARVARLQRSRTPPGYVTVVVLTTLTSPTGAGKSIAEGLNELRGAWLAQRAVNAQAEEGSNLPVRLVMANGGGNSAYADRAARRIVRLARHDRTVVAVTGLGQSREATRRAIMLLGAAGIPMVGSTNSADTLADTPYYFRVAANNAREARVVLAYADATWHPRTAAVLADPDDTYSANLADDFTAAFAPRRATLLTYHAQSGRVAEQMLAAVRRICRDRPDLIYYAGRANEFSLLGFLDHPGPDGCPDYAAHIVGGDDLENLGTPPRADFTLGQSGALLFTAWATPDPRLPGGLEHPGAAFYADYAARFGGAYPAAHAVLAHDALALVGDMVRERYLPYVRPHVSRADLYQKLHALAGDTQWRGGASGVIAFDRGTPVDKTVVVVSIEPAGQPSTVGICGRLTPTFPQSPFCPAET